MAVIRIGYRKYIAEKPFKHFICYKPIGGLSCSFALNGSSHFASTVLPAGKIGFALCSLALEPDKAFALWVLVLISENLFLYYKPIGGLEPPTY